MHDKRRLNEPDALPDATRRPWAIGFIADRVVASAARLPWWAIVIAVGLVAMFYAIFTSNLYSRSFKVVTSNFQQNTNRFAVVSYVVRNSDGSTAPLLGTLTTSQDNSKETIITQDEELVSIPVSDIGKIACGDSLTAANCPINSTVTIIRGSVEGALIGQPSLGQYSIATPLGQTLVVDKVGTIGETRTPPNCNADTEGSCTIQVLIDPDYPLNRSEGISAEGILVDNSAGQLTVQTKPPISVTVNKADIVHVNYVNLGACALNNLGSCDGIFFTIEVTLTAFAIAMVLGLFFGLMRVSSNMFLFNISTLYVEVIRGIPIIVILLLVQFALPSWLRENFPPLAPSLALGVGLIAFTSVLYYLLIRWRYRRTEPLSLFQPVFVSLFMGGALIALIFFAQANTPIGPTRTEPIQSGIIGLAIVYGAYLAELFRAGIQSIGRGQMEAARSLGLTYIQAMRHIILPQAFRVILPPLGNDFIAMLKDSSLVAIIGVSEMTYRAQLFAAKTFKTFEPFITIAVLYLVMTLFLSMLVRIVERRMSLAHR